MRGFKNLAVFFKDKMALKRKENSNGECYTFHKLGHFEKDRYFSDRTPNKNTQ